MLAQGPTVMPMEGGGGLYFTDFGNPEHLRQEAGTCQFLLFCSFISVP